MKLRSITLHNVRRFQNVTAQISGISDGITTICAPNESGKSTFFDALHAVFFFPHSGQSQDIKSLQPYSKGSVDISVEVEDDKGHPWRIEKRYLASKSAVITDLVTDRVHAQADEAEDWIRNLIGADMHGPTGLLWVRQGVSGFGPDGSGTREKNEREKLREARQGLMSSVAGQIDNVTGGRRMDNIMKSCEADLEALATKTGSAKAGGEWSKAQKLVQELQADEARLSAQVSELSDALKERAELRISLKKADDPESSRARAEAISSAEADLEKAIGHEAKIIAAHRDKRLSELEAKGYRDRLQLADDAISLKTKQDTALSQAKIAAEQADEAARLSEKDYSAAKSAHTEVQGRLKTARDNLALAHAQAAGAQSRRRRKEIENLLARIDGFEKTQKAQGSLVRDNPFTPDLMKKLEDLAKKVSMARAMQDASAASFRMSYSGSRRLLTEDGELVADQDHSLTQRLDIQIADVGTLSLFPAASSSDASLQEACQNLDTLLSHYGADNLETARERARNWQDASNAEALARQSIETLIPDGPEALRRELTELPDIKDGDTEQSDHDIPALKRAVDELEKEERDAASELETARRHHAAHTETAAEARAEQRLAADQAATLPAGLLSEEERTAEEQLLADANAKTQEIGSEIDDLAASAPDKDAAEAELLRLTSARDNAAREREQMQNRLHELGGIIRARAEDNAEACLAETRGALEKAQSREKRYRFEVQALTELRDHLDTARREARDAYFEPVKKEIIPLLSMLHDSATVEMDSDTMLPARIVRDGIADDLDVLSGGAAEQLAILTRLAFARLYAKSGKQVPIILDDALVHSDDDRIIRMFTALTRSSKDQQIIVFSCRTRAFSELGGTRCQISSDPIKKAS